MRKKTAQDYHDLAKKRDFEWVGRTFPENVLAKTSWQCSARHKWKTSYSHIQRGDGCPQCSGLFPKTVKEYYNLAESHGFEWIGEELPKNVRQRTLWRCLEGHEWKIPYTNIQGGNGCPHCSGNFPRGADDYLSLAKNKDFEWIGEFPPNTGAKTLWRCSRGHEWEARYNSIQQDSGCPHCYHTFPKTIEDYHDLAKERGFEWVGKFQKGAVMLKTLWRCSKGHEWESPYNSIRAGTSCPDCLGMVNGRRVSKPQVELCEMLGGELNYPCGRKTIDVALPNKMIAVEYDCWFWHGHRQEEDAKRDAYLLASGWKVLHIKANRDRLPSWQELDEAFAKIESGKKIVGIVFDDWGKGKTFVDVRAQRHSVLEEKLEMIQQLELL